MTRHQDVIELLDGYALDALEPDEALTVEEHLGDCAECRQRLAEHREALATLPAAIGSVSPLRLHPAVKRSVMRSLDSPVPSRRRPPPSPWAWAAIAALA